MRDTENVPPFISKEIVDFIEKSYPMKDFEVSGKFEDMLFHYGQRSVVRFIKHKFNEQNENLLNKNQG